MWMVLCHTYDTGALWAYRGLKARGLEPLELVTAEVLAYSVRWAHRVASDDSSIDVTLADGRRLRGADLCGVLNRLLTVPTELWRRTDAGEREYVEQELYAFYLSWLAGLTCPVVNRATPQGFAGTWRHESEWVWLASRAGLPAPRFVVSSDDPPAGQGVAVRLRPAGASVKTAIVVGEAVVGDAVPPEIGDGCRRLAELSGTSLLGVDFVSGPTGEWTFAGASPTPDLAHGGAPLLDRLAAALGARLGAGEVAS
jgi:hypothetical protein